MDRFQVVYIVEYNLVGNCEIVDSYLVVFRNIISVDALFVGAYIGVSKTIFYVVFFEQRDIFLRKIRSQNEFVFIRKSKDIYMPR